MGEKSSSQKKSRVFDACPHCGHELSPWERVLLGVDRALMCKQCWYRIILDVSGGEQEGPPEGHDQSKGKRV